MKKEHPLFLAFPTFYFFYIDSFAFREKDLDINIYYFIKVSFPFSKIFFKLRRVNLKLERQGVFPSRNDYFMFLKYLTISVSNTKKNLISQFVKRQRPINLAQNIINYAAFNYLLKINEENKTVSSEGG